jgi:anti-sigma B factor antagonist
VNCPCKLLASREREEPIPLLGDNSTCLGTLKIEIASREDGALMRICGCLDIDNAPALRNRFLALFEAPHAKVVNIDLSAVTHMDSSGVATLIEALKIARSYNTEMRLQGLQGRLLSLFQATGILTLFNQSTQSNTQSRSKAV